MSGIGRQMALAQERYDAMQPPEFYEDPDDLPPTEDEAIEAATDELMTTPGTILQALGDIGCDVRSPVPLFVLADSDLCYEDQTSATLLVLMFGPGDERRREASAVLFERIKASIRADIAERADELMRAAA